jgi:hypothetical protein
MSSSWRYMWQSYERGGVATRLLRSDSSGAAQSASSSDATAGPRGGDKILLPTEVLTAVMQSSTDGSDSPLTFQLTPAYSSTRCFCGVLEFTSPSGVVTLPPSVVDALGLSLQDQLDPSKLISIRPVSLPKATSVRLQVWCSDAIVSFCPRQTAIISLSPPPPLPLRLAAPHSRLLGDSRPTGRSRVYASKPVHGTSR